jgi:hypothetical protein
MHDDFLKLLEAHIIRLFQDQDHRELLRNSAGVHCEKRQVAELPTVVGFFPSSENRRASTARRILCHQLLPAPRIHDLTIVTGAGVAEVTIYIALD